MTKDTKEVAGKNPLQTVKQQKDAPMLKVVIRCLPPTLTEEEFVKLVEPLTGHDFFSFVKADSSLGLYACSRAYINFLKQVDVLTFRDKWDGFPFKDTNGREYPAVVEHAPYQKIPKKANRKADPRCGTIEEDEDYIKFLEALNAEIEPLPSAEAYLEELEAKQRAAATARVTTPLIDFLKKKRIERIKARDKVREERRQKEKERKRQREEEKKRQDRDRRKKKEERERRERDAKQKKEEAAKSDGEKKARDRDKVKEDDKKKSRETDKKDSQIKLLKKNDKDSKSDSEERVRDQGKGGGGGGRDFEQARGKYDTDKRKPETAYSKSINDKRKPSGRDSRDKDWDRYRDRDRGGGRDRYADRERDRRPPSKISSQESVQRAGKSRSGDKIEGRDGHRDGDERKGDKREDRTVGKGDTRGDRDGKDGGRKTTLELKKAEEEKERELKREERKIRNKDRPDMARYQPGQRSWSSRTTKKEEGSNSARTSPTLSEGERPKAEAKKPETSTQKSSTVTGDGKNVEEKRPTAAKKFETQVRSSSGRSSVPKEDTRGKPEQRSGDRNRERGGVGRGYREERSNRNRHRLDDARRKAEEGRNGKGPDPTE